MSFMRDDVGSCALRKPRRRNNRIKITTEEAVLVGLVHMRYCGFAGLAGAGYPRLGPLAAPSKPYVLNAMLFRSLSYLLYLSHVSSLLLLPLKLFQTQIPEP